MNTSKRRIRGGFTLVELLVVITIIAIMAAILTPVVFGVLVRAQEAAIEMEIKAIEEKLEEYKTAHGQYPPDGTDLRAVQQHLLTLFPRRNIAKDLPRDATTGKDLNWQSLDPAEALVFFLQGYSASPEFPVRGLPGEERQPLFEFDQTRLLVGVQDLDKDGWPEYVPPRGQGTPYVYFNAATYERASTTGYTCKNPRVADTGAAKPYTSSVVRNEYVNPRSFQIISAGLDGIYGSGGSFPAGAGYSEGDRDNLTNFFKKTLVDAIQ